MKNTTVKNLASCLLILASCFPASAQTNVSGFINANTTWTLAGSPYIVVANALVSQGYTLTIDPGVVIKFDTNCALQVDGQLIAIGTAQNRITFTSNKAIPTAGDWAELHFSDYCISAVFDGSGNYLSGTIMKYCDVLYGGSLLNFGVIHIESSSPYFNNCSIMHSKSCGIYCNGSSCKVDSSVVNDCTRSGLSFSNITLNSCGLSILSDTIENNGGGLGIGNSLGCRTIIKNNYFISNSNGAISGPNIDSVYITGNYFINNKGYSSVITLTGNHYSIAKNYFMNDSIIMTGNGSMLYLSGDNLSIIENYFANNYAQGVNAGPAILNIGGNNNFIAENNFINNSALGIGGAIVLGDFSLGDTVECNLFTTNQTGQGAQGALSMHSVYNGIIRNNIFDGNYNNSPGGISVAFVSGGGSNPPLYFTNNTIKNNSSPSNICCEFRPQLGYPDVLHVDHNDFINNTAKSIFYITGPNTGNANVNFLYMRNNNFNDPSAQYELYNDIPYGSPNIYPDSNYWGSTSTQHIDSVINDYFDNAIQSVVYYQPILSSPVFVDTTCSFLSTYVATIAHDSKEYSKPFPNPFSTYTQIIFKDELKDASLTIYNIFGQKVKSIQHISGNHLLIQRENLQSGIYIYDISEKGKRLTNGKLIVE